MINALLLFVISKLQILPKKNNKRIIYLVDKFEFPSHDLTPRLKSKTAKSYFFLIFENKH